MRHAFHFRRVRWICAEVNANREVGSCLRSRGVSRGKEPRAAEAGGQLTRRAVEHVRAARMRVSGGKREPIGAAGGSRASREDPGVYQGRGLPQK